VDNVKLRASYGTSFRAPTFPEIFGNSTAIYIQPFQNPNAPPSSIPGYKLGSGPNPDVGPETATTWTLGADIEPMFGLKIGLTYFDIAFKNTISNLLSNLSILTYADEYAGTDTILFGQAAYDRIIDLSTNGFAGTGPIAFRAGGAGYPPGAFDCANGINIQDCVFVDGRSLNLGRTRMRGIDFDTRYSMQAGTGATVTFQLNGTYLTAYDVAFTPGGGYNDLLNYIFQPLKFKARAAVSWDQGPLNARLMLTHVHGYTNDTVDPVQHVASYTPVDLSFGWRLSDSFNAGKVDALTLGVELRNMFDTDPPFVNSRPGPNAGGGYDATVANPVGRELAVSLRAKF
jgi:iron complex outermembrane receptor protein